MDSYQLPKPTVEPSAIASSKNAGAFLAVSSSGSKSKAGNGGVQKTSSGQNTVLMKQHYQQQMMQSGTSVGGSLKTAAGQRQKEILSKSQSPHTSQAQKQLHYQHVNSLFKPDAYGSNLQQQQPQSYLSSAQQRNEKIQPGQGTAEGPQRATGFSYGAKGGGQGSGSKGVMNGLQQAPSMPYLVQKAAAHEAYSLASQSNMRNAGGGAAGGSGPGGGNRSQFNQSQASRIVNKAAIHSSKDQIRKQKKILGVFTNYGGALSNNSNEGHHQGSGTLAEIQKPGSANRIYSKGGSVNSDGSGKSQQSRGNKMDQSGQLTKFAAYQTQIQVNSLKQTQGGASAHNRKTPKFLASSNMNLQNQASFGAKPIKQNQSKTRNNMTVQNRTMQAAVMGSGGSNDGGGVLDPLRFREQQYFHGSGGPYRVKTNKGSQEPRTSALTEQNKEMKMFQTDDPESEKQHKLRMKKKLLMSDSLQMLTKQRNQYLHHSINKSIQSKNNSQKSNQSREPRIAGGGVSITCVVGNEEQNDAMYSAINDQQIQTITMHNSINSSNNLHDTHQSSLQSSITGSFNQPAQASDYHHHQVSMGSRKELSFRYKEGMDGRIEHVYSGEYTEPELIEGLGGDECISSRRQTKHSPSFPQSIVTSANAGQTIVHSVNSQDNMSSTGTIMKNTSGGAPGLSSVAGSRVALEQNMVQGSNGSNKQQHGTKSFQQKAAINVKKAMVKVSQGFKEKFNAINVTQQKVQPQSDDAAIVAGGQTTVGAEGKQIIDKVDFAQKLQKVQDDIRLRNEIQEQRELELNRLQQDFQDQITDANKNSAQQSMMESSSRELTFQLKELERLQHQSSFDINPKFDADMPPHGIVIKSGLNENMKLNLKLNSHREVTEKQLGGQLNDITLGKSQQSARFQNMHHHPNQHSDRFNQRQVDMQKQRNLMSQNLMQTEQLAQLGGNLALIDDQAIQLQNINKFEEIEEGCTGHDSRRAQLRMSHSPLPNNNFTSQIDTSEQNYGHEISQNSQMTPTVGQFQASISSNQKALNQKQERVPHNIKMRPLNLNQFHQATGVHVGGDKFRKQFNFHAQLSSSRLSLKGDITGAKMSERDAETERKGKLPSSRSSLMASQNIQQITHRSKLDRILNVKVTKKGEDWKSKQFTDSADTGGQKNDTKNSLNTEGEIQLANMNNIGSTHLAAYGSGSKRGLNSRNSGGANANALITHPALQTQMQGYSDLKSPTQSGVSRAGGFGAPAGAGSVQKQYDEQIYMTIGQADPHPSQQTQIEMSASHLEQSNTSNVNSSQTSHHVHHNEHPGIDQHQKGQKKKFSTISHDEGKGSGNQASKEQNLRNFPLNSPHTRLQKKIRINELPVSPRNKGLPQGGQGVAAARVLVKSSTGNLGQLPNPSSFNQMSGAQNPNSKNQKVHLKDQEFEEGNRNGDNYQVESCDPKPSTSTQLINNKMRRLQESRSLETNERMMQMTLSENQKNLLKTTSDSQNPHQSSGTAATGHDHVISSQQNNTNKKLKSGKKGQNQQQNTLEFQLTGKGQYKLVKVKNRSQDPFTRKQDIKHLQNNTEDYNMQIVTTAAVGHNQNMQYNPQTGQLPNLKQTSPNHQKEYLNNTTIEQVTPQTAPSHLMQSSSAQVQHYNSRRNPAIDSSGYPLNSNFKVMVVRSSDGQRKQIGLKAPPLAAKFGQSGQNAYEGQQQSANEYVHPGVAGLQGHGQQNSGKEIVNCQVSGQKKGELRLQQEFEGFRDNKHHIHKIHVGRSQSSNLEKSSLNGVTSSKNLKGLTTVGPNQQNLVAGGGNGSYNGSSLSDNYAAGGANGQAGAKRANSTQSDQLKRSKINASQLFDNSFLCCLTQTKQKKNNNLREYR